VLCIVLVKLRKNFTKLVGVLLLNHFLCKSDDNWILSTSVKITIFLIFSSNNYRHKWVPVTTACRILSLWMEERPPIWRVAVDRVNKQSRTADTLRSSGSGVGRGVDSSSP